MVFIFKMEFTNEALNWTMKIYSEYPPTPMIVVSFRKRYALYCCQAVSLTGVVFYEGDSSPPQTQSE